MKHFTLPAIKTPTLPEGHQLLGSFGVILGGLHPHLELSRTSLVVAVDSTQQGYLAVADDCGHFLGPPRHATLLDGLDYCAELELRHWDDGLTIHNAGVLQDALNAYWEWREGKA